MRRNNGRKVIATLAAAGVTVGFASTADAARSHHRSVRSDGDIRNHVDQDSDVFIAIGQRARSNTGFNYQDNFTIQGNSADQDADSNANGGDADAATGRRGGDADASAAAAAAEVVTEAIATGGEGGDAAAANEAEQGNDAESSNALSTGDATSANVAEVDVEQSQHLEINNSIIQNIQAAFATATAGGATATLPVFPEHVEATIVNNVDQDADATVIVDQSASSNTGGNGQSNTTIQGNDLDQDADADANGGDADAYTGGSGDADASGTVVAAASVETVADALGGDGGEAVAVNEAEQSNDSDSSNVMVTGDATSANVAEVSIGQDLAAEIANELELAIGD